jgi:hypothetical protein
VPNPTPTPTATTHHPQPAQRATGLNFFKQLQEEVAEEIVHVASPQDLGTNASSATHQTFPSQAVVEEVVEEVIVLKAPVQSMTWFGDLLLLFPVSVGFDFGFV